MWMKLCAWLSGGSLCKCWFDNNEYFNWYHTLSLSLLCLIVKLIYHDGNAMNIIIVKFHFEVKAFLFL